MSDKPLISLACNNRDYVGIIFRGPTGVLYSNQVGGTSCCHPSVEGFFVPLSVGVPDEEFDPLLDIYPDPYTRADVDKVTALIALLGLEEDLVAPAPGECEDQEIGEAWVPVKVREDGCGRHSSRFGALHNLRGRVGVLTYPNSD